MDHVNQSIGVQVHRALLAIALAILLGGCDGSKGRVDSNVGGAQGVGGATALGGATGLGGSTGGGGSAGVGGVSVTGTGGAGGLADTRVENQDTLVDNRIETSPPDRSVADVVGVEAQPPNPALDAVCTPQLTLQMPDATGQVFLDAMGGSVQTVEAIVQAIGRDICRVLYRKPEEVRAASSIDLVIRDYAGVAAKSGDLGKIKVEISTRHLQGVKSAGRDVAQEIKGILYHEMTHMYQQDDKPEGTWTGLPNYYEAGADAVRMRHGYLPAGCRPSKAGQWFQHNYCAGGYWWLWVDTKFPNFLYQLNLLMKGRDMKPFAVVDATAIAGTSLDDLWKEYQTATCCSDSSTACCK